MDQAFTLESLRKQMSAVTARHEADADAAARAFWAGFVGTTGSAAGARHGGGAGGSRRVGFGRDRTRYGRTGCRAPSTPTVGRGPWAEVCEGAEPVCPAEAVYDGAESACAYDDVEWIAPREADWREHEDRGDLAGLRIDASLGRPIEHHRAGDVQSVAEQVAAARGTADVQLVNLVADLEHRGQAVPGGLSRVDWLRSLAPALTGGQAKAFVTVARAMHDPVWRELATQVNLQLVSVPQAAEIIDFHTRVSPAAEPEDLAVALGDLLGQAPALRLEQLRRLARHHTEQVRPPRDEDRADAGRRAARGLWFGQPSANGMVGFRGTLDPDAAATMKAAVDALSRPAPEQDECGETIATDPRTPATRRADALVALISRAVEAAKGVPVTDKAKVVVTIDLETLLGQVAGAGLAMTGDVLSAETIRRMACDAQIIPMVLGRKGEVLDLGLERRLVTRGLRLALWERDGGCSFPGCTVPATWCDAHHVTHWARGGRTSLLNSALLCRRHHTYVHQNDLAAAVTATTVTWHL